MTLDMKTLILGGTIAYVLYLIHTDAPVEKFAAQPSGPVLTRGIDANNKQPPTVSTRREQNNVAQQPDQHRPIDQSPINPKLLRLQYHVDYTDIITVIRQIVPTQKQIFNVANRPLKYFEPETSEAGPLVNMFMAQLNRMMKEAQRSAPAMDGFTAHSKELGVPVLYENKNVTSAARLVGIKQVQKYQTNDELKYLVRFAIGRDGVDDQILLRIGFVIQQTELDEDDFFSSTNKQIPPRVRIEQIFIEGVLVANGKGSYEPCNEQDKMFEIDDLERNQLTDPKAILKALEHHHQQKFREMMGRNATIDEDGRVFDMDAYKSVQNTESYRTTRTIFDDFQGERSFS